MKILHIKKKITKFSAGHNGGIGLETKLFDLHIHLSDAEYTKNTSVIS